MPKAALRLHYRYSPHLERFIWFVEFKVSKYVTGYYNTSGEAIKTAGEYFT